jgi:hypothetical protein
MKSVSQESVKMIKSCNNRVAFDDSSAACPMI